MDAIKDKIMGYAKGDSGSGDYQNKNLDVDKYAKEHSGSTSEYSRGSGGELLDKPEVTSATRDTSGYSAESQLPEHERHHTQDTSEYTSKDTGRSGYGSTGETGGSTYDESRGIDMTGATPSMGLDTTESSGYTTRETTTTGMTSGSGTEGYNSSAIYTIPVENQGEVMAGRAYVPGQIVSSDTTYESGLSDASKYAMRDATTAAGSGQMNYTSEDVTSSTMTGASTQGYSDNTASSTGDYSSTQTDAAGYGDAKALDRGSGANATGASRGTVIGGRTDTSDDSGTMDKVKGAMAEARSSTGDSGSAESSGLGYGDSKALDRGSGANATGASRGSVAAHGNKYASSGDTSSERKPSLMDKAKAMFSGGGSSTDDYNYPKGTSEKTSSYQGGEDTSSSQSGGAGYGHSRAIDQGSGANATGASRDTVGTGSGMNTSSGYGTRSSGATGSEGMSASDEAEKVRAGYEKNSDTYAPTKSQGPSSGTTANVDDSSSYGQDTSSSTGGNLSHAIGGNYGSSSGNTDSTGGGMMERAKDEYEGMKGTTNSTGFQGSGQY